jgi:hypothetical protein
VTHSVWLGRGSRRTISTGPGAIMQELVRQANEAQKQVTPHPRIDGKGPEGPGLS